MSDHSSDLISRLTAFFIGFDRQDPALIKALSDFEGEIKLESSCLIFTLQGLYQYLELAPALSFSSFRSQLYQSNLNEQLAASGLVIAVYRSSGKVDSSWYQLTALKTGSEF